MSVPGDRRDTEPEESEAEPRPSRRRDAEAGVAPFDVEVAHGDGSTAAGSAPQDGGAVRTWTERLQQGRGQHRMVDDQREGDLVGGSDTRAPEEHAERDENGTGPAALSRLEPVREDPAASYSPTRRPCSTIGAGGLNGRVRDGNGCFPSAITAGNRIVNLDGQHGEQASGNSPRQENYGQAARPFSTG